ncbi:MAG: hypothetical protein WAU86_04460 [Oricola sp.]
MTALSHGGFWPRAHAFWNGLLARFPRRSGGRPLLDPRDLSTSLQRDIGMLDTAPARGTGDTISRDAVRRVAEHRGRDWQRHVHETGTPKR